MTQEIDLEKKNSTKKISELEQDIADMKRQFEETVNEYEDRIAAMEEDKKTR